MSYCPKGLRKKLEKLGLSKAETNFQIWKTEMLIDKKYNEITPEDSELINEDHWNKANVDDGNRANEAGLKKHGNGQWGDKTEKCIHGLKAKGKSLSSAIAICRPETKDE